MRETMNQTGLARRLGRAASTLRAMGDTVRGVTADNHREVWKRLTRFDGRLAGYELVERENRSPKLES